MSETSKELDKRQWRTDVLNAIQGAGVSFSALRSAFSELYQWNEDSDCSFGDVEHEVKNKLRDIEDYIRLLRCIIFYHGRPFIEEKRDIQFDLDMKEIAGIAGGVDDDDPVYTGGEIR